MNFSVSSGYMSAAAAIAEDRERWHIDHIALRCNCTEQRDCINIKNMFFEHLNL